MMARLARGSFLCLAGLVLARCGGGDAPGDLDKSVSDIVVCPGRNTVQGLDVSEWQGGIDWGAVARSGRSFAYIRVSDGFYRDRTFARNWAGAHAAGMIRGAYQYFQPNLDPVGQANLLIDAIGGSLGSGELPPMLDVESANAGTSSGAILSAMHRWAERIEAVLHKKPVIYTGAWWWNPNTGYSGQFSGYPLNDSYYSTSCPNIAAGWSNWTFWQFTSSGRVPGIGGNVDLDSFNGTLAELRAFAGGGSPPPSGPCAGRHGLWCGSELGLASNTLYRCENGSAQEVEACHYGCHENPPGVNDRCNAAPPPKGPCTGRLPGLYCGSEIGLDGNTLYNCERADQPVGSQRCAAGCQVNPPGVNDACKPPPGPCTGRAAGRWCGSEIGLDANTVYTCNGNANPVASEGCGYGCQVNPPGVNDACKPPPAGPCTGREPGYYCGVTLGLASNTLFACDGDAGASTVQACDEGCQVNPPGVDDQCYSGDCTDLPDGAYCGNDNIGGNPALLYSCSGGQISSASACANGCASMPQGTNDYCR